MYQSYTKMYLTPALGLRYFKLHLPVENEVGKQVKGMFWTKCRKTRNDLKGAILILGGSDII